jgi:hypothetical protein
MIRLCMVLGSALAADIRARDRRPGDVGSVTLEQIAITAGLLALAIGVVAGIGVAVAKYMGKL